MASTNDNKVLIIGAGPAGLCLGRILQQNKIPFELFERDAAHHTRSQGWAVALHQSLPKLLSTLDTQSLGDIEKLSVNAPVGEYDSLAIVDGSAKLLNKFEGSAAGDPNHILRVRREQFRDYLWGDDLPVSTGKIFDHYTEDNSGVTAHFRDGSSARGSMLVGVDGASSHVRTQLLGLHSSLSSFIPIVGSKRFSYDQIKAFRELSNTLIAVVEENLRFMVCTFSIEADKSSAEYYWLACFRSNDSEADSKWATHASKQELYDRALAITSHLPAPYSTIVEETGVDDMTTPPLVFREFSPPDTFPPGRVTLVGDAAHAMVPFRGAGANTALEDACDLGRILIDRYNHSDHSTNAVAEILQSYANQCIPRAQAIVAASHAAGERSAQMGLGK